MTRILQRRLYPYPLPCSTLLVGFLASLVIISSSCDLVFRKQLQVTATAYNSLPYQTTGNPSITAWGDTLEPGMKCIAISRDLLDSGLYHGLEVTIDGLPGTYTVRDKMHRRWNNKIDIYMGEDVQAARNWGRRTVMISWEVE